MIIPTNRGPWYQSYILSTDIQPKIKIKFKNQETRVKCKSKLFFILIQRLQPVFLEAKAACQRIHSVRVNHQFVFYFICGTCKVTWAMKRLSSLYEMAQDTLQGQSKDCLKIRILIFSEIFKILFFCNFFSNKKIFIKKRQFFIFKKVKMRYRNNSPGCFTSTVWT